MIPFVTGCKYVSGLGRGDTLYSAGSSRQQSAIESEVGEIGLCRRVVASCFSSARSISYLQIRFVAFALPPDTDFGVFEAGRCRTQGKSDRTLAA